MEIIVYNLSSAGEKRVHNGTPMTFVMCFVHFALHVNYCPSYTVWHGALVFVCAVLEQIKEKHGTWFMNEKEYMQSVGMEQQ